MGGPHATLPSPGSGYSAAPFSCASARDDISLEATDAQIVRGTRVKVGNGCRIDTVEYSESLEVSPRATVQNRIKT